MICDAFKLAVPGVRGLQPYRVGKPISELERELGLTDTLKLASNENPLGPPPAAVAAIQAVLPELAMYPDANCFVLKQRLAEHLGVSGAQLTFGNGSNDVLVLLAEAFLLPGLEAVYSQYGFAVFALATAATGATARIAPALPSDHAQPLGHDLQAIEALISERTRLVFIANPNNPTGSWIPRDELYAFLQRIPSDVVVVVDEAYHEYVEEPDYSSALTWLDEFPNLVVTRTFSKIWGLAGLRVGYAVSSVEIADLLNRIRQPFNINAVAQAAAVAALDSPDYLQESLRINREGLAHLRTTAADLGLWHGDSVCNFLLIDVGRAAGQVYQDLLQLGVIVRPMDGYGLTTHLRITTGLSAQMERFDRGLRQVLGSR